MPGAPALTVLRCGATALLLAVAVLLPYLNKAFTIDDPLFLRSAEQVVRDPLHPTAFSIVWDEDIPIQASQGLFVTGPVTAYLLAPSILLGGAEWPAHLVQLTFYVAASLRPFRWRFG